MNEQNNQSEALERIMAQVGEAYYHAIKKHPFFAHCAWEVSGVEEAMDNLTTRRAWLGVAEETARVTGEQVLGCEFAEARVEYEQKRYDACLVELAQCIAVLIRIMEMVEKKGGEK